MRRLFFISAGAIIGTAIIKGLFTLTEIDFLRIGISIIIAYPISFFFVKNKTK